MTLRHILSIVSFLLAMAGPVFASSVEWSTGQLECPLELRERAEKFIDGVLSKNRRTLKASTFSCWEFDGTLEEVARSASDRWRTGPSKTVEVGYESGYRKSHRETSVMAGARDTRKPYLISVVDWPPRTRVMRVEFTSAYDSRAPVVHPEPFWPRTVDNIRERVLTDLPALRGNPWIERSCTEFESLTRDTQGEYDVCVRVTSSCGALANGQDRLHVALQSETLSDDRGWSSSNASDARGTALAERVHETGLVFSAKRVNVKVVEKDGDTSRDPGHASICSYDLRLTLDIPPGYDGIRAAAGDWRPLAEKLVEPEHRKSLVRYVEGRFTRSGALEGLIVSSHGPIWLVRYESAVWNRVGQVANGELVDAVDVNEDGLLEMVVRVTGTNGPDSLRLLSFINGQGETRVLFDSSESLGDVDARNLRADIVHGSQASRLLRVGVVDAEGKIHESFYELRHHRYSRLEPALDGSSMIAANRGTSEVAATAAEEHRLSSADGRFRRTDAATSGECGHFAIKELSIQSTIEEARKVHPGLTEDFRYEGAGAYQHRYVASQPKDEKPVLELLTNENGQVNTIQAVLDISRTTQENMWDLMLERWGEPVTRSALQFDGPAEVRWRDPGCDTEIDVRGTADLFTVKITSISAALEHVRRLEEEKREIALNLLDAPMATAAESRPLTAGEAGVTKPILIPESKTAPEYPELARVARLEAHVILQAIIRRDGTVSELEVLHVNRPGMGFEEEAIAAVSQWRYEPALKDGRPVDVHFTTVVEFELVQDPSASR